MADQIHIFEQAGLGKAPFHSQGVEYKVYVSYPGGPAQPGSTCDLCGQAISYECWVGSADGRRFKVGNECIEKTGDAGLVKSQIQCKLVKGQEADKRKASRDEQYVQDNLAAWEAKVADQARNPHPYGKDKGTNADYLRSRFESSNLRDKVKLMKGWL